VPEDVPPEVKYLQLFGDPAYRATYQICSPFTRVGEQTVEEQEWNHQMLCPWMSAENGFGEVVAQWPFLNTFWKLCIYQSPIGHYYQVVVLLTNAINCFLPNLIAQWFDVQPPKVEEYFHD
ncbi:hypothetical protein C8R44DRAFT_621297, partial [Mycena epipterygia]